MQKVSSRFNHLTFFSHIFLETFDNFINVGHEIHCDIAPQALEPDAWVATVAWIGGLDAKPDIEAINWHHQLNRNAQRGKIFFPSNCNGSVLDSVI